MISIAWVPSLSSHIDLAKSILNGIIQEKPEYADTIAALAVYPVQKWAAEKKKNSSFCLSLSEDVNRKHSLISISLVENRNDRTAEYCRLMEDVLHGSLLSAGEKKVISQIHDISDKDTTLYSMKKYYKSAVMKICSACGDQISSFLKDEKKKEMDEENKLVYHDTDDLIRLMPYLRKKSTNESSRIEYINTLDEIGKAIEMLKEYPFTSGVYDSIYGKFHGYTVNRIAVATGKSRAYVESKYDEGIMVLSQILWGVQACYIALDGDN